MLENICGSQNVKKILLFLFVNGKCYGTQMHRLLSTPLTPIQKGLERLEKGGIVRSYYEGKTRVFQFNPAYPLLEELEQLLKKAYILLSVEEKKSFCLVREQRYLKTALYKNHEQVLIAFWQRLALVKELIFNAKTKTKEGWNGKGSAEVVVAKEKDHVLIFHEKGTWKGKSHQEMDFSNIFRWTLDRVNCLISLEHLRHGVQHPVFLFHLTPSENGTLISVDSHLFEGDTYFGQGFYDQHSLRLNWRVIGPHKNEEIDYYYK